LEVFFMLDALPLRLRFRLDPWALSLEVEVMLIFETLLICRNSPTVDSAKLFSFRAFWLGLLG
jgi:hypothetical protein